MKKNILLLFILLDFSSAFAQGTKIFNGNFEIRSTMGIAHYTYYENLNYERVYNGSFSFTSLNDLLKITGAFKDDRRVGDWHFTATNFRSPEQRILGIKNLNFDVCGSYINGEMNGPWSLKREVNFLEPKMGTIIENSTVNFKKNHLVGKFNFSYKHGKDLSATVSGLFDDNGHKTGIWIANSVLGSGITVQSINKYKADTLYFRIIRNLSDGRVLYKLENGVESSERFTYEEVTDVNKAVSSWTSEQYSGYTNMTDRLAFNPIFEIDKGLTNPNEGNNEETIAKVQPIGESGKVNQNAESNEQNKIYSSVEAVPEFPGGVEKFGNFLSKNIKYPTGKNKTRLRVILTFYVELDGNLSNIVVAKGANDFCDKEAVRVMKQSPKWRPGIQNGRPVRCQYSVPISFTPPED